MAAIRPYGGRGMTGVAAGRQVGDLRFIPVGVEPGLGQERQVDCVVIHELGWKFHIVFVVSQLEWAELQREGTHIRSAWWTIMEWAAE